MKKSICVELVDVHWLKPVPAETVAEIERFFAEHPDYKQKFDLAENRPAPTICNIWLNLTDAEKNELENKISLLPEKFTADAFFTITHLSKDHIQEPPTSHLLNLLGNGWEVDKEKEFLYYGAEIRDLRR